MARATVLIPTHDHGETVLRAIASVRRQTVADFELLVVGDGAPARLQPVMARLCAEDPRIRFLDNPKGPGHGELHRHAALRAACGEIVCYLGDDDLWLPHHLETMLAALADADFAHSIYVNVRPDGEVAPRSADLADPATRRRLLSEPWNVVAPTCAGHRLDAYRRLPLGWRTKPADVWSDLHMWRQWAAQPWCRFRSIPQATSLSFPDARRPGVSPAQRLAELDAWLGRSVEPGFAAWLADQVVRAWLPRTEMPAWHAARRAGLTFSHMLRHAGQPEEALRVARKALELTPQDEDVHLAIGELLAAQGALAEAEASLRRAIAIRPDHAGVHRALSEVLARQGRRVAAIDAVRQAVALKEGDALLHLQLGRLLAQAGADAEAEAVLRRAIALRPPAASAAEAQRRLARLLVRRGAFAEALPVARKAVALAPDAARAHHLLGAALAETGAPAEAAAAFRRAVALDPGLAAPHHGLSGLHERAGRLEDAIAAARQAVALDPGSDVLRRHLDRLHAARDRDVILLRDPQARAGG